MRRLLTSLPAMVTLILLIGVTTIAVSRARTSDARMADFPDTCLLYTSPSPRDS